MTKFAVLLKSQKGFGSTAIIVVVMIVGVVGLAGWLVYQNNHKPSDVTGQTVGPDTKTPTTPVSDSAKSPAPTGDNAAVITANYSDSPSALQSAILNETKLSAPSCVKNNNIVDIDGKPIDNQVKYSASGYAFTGIGCDGVAATLFVKVGSSWKKISSTQAEYKCADLKANKVPSSFIRAIQPDPNTQPECIPVDPSANASEAYNY